MKNTIILTNAAGEIIATLDSGATMEMKVGFSARPGQHLHQVGMPDAYHAHKSAGERGEWLKQYRIKNGALVRQGG